MILKAVSAVKAVDVLKKYYGYEAFRPGQAAIVQALLNNRDVMCVMPTGAGKSVCYQIPALMSKGLSIVISPLISLMKDQVTALNEAGIPAAYLNSSLTLEQYRKVLQNLRRYRYKLIYVAPERLLVPAFLECCQALEIALIAVDEAHCVSQWGQDFRPHYLKIVDFIASLPKRPVIGAFTATATAEVKEDIINILRLNEPFCLTTGFDRTNLFFSVEKPQNKLKRVIQLVNKYRHQSGIIYCATRKNVEEVTEALNKAGFSATKYHAGLSDRQRRKNQDDFVFDRCQVMAATNAFGMGIDKSNVSYVIHFNMPKSIEAYYQEAGRAGRDGSPADCILLYSGQDVRLQQFLILNAEPNPDLEPDQQEAIRQKDMERLKYMTFYATAESCLRAMILRYFGEQAEDYCGHCSNCLAHYQTKQITREARLIVFCVKETGQRFGEVMIADILKGSKNEKLKKWQLDSHPAYGLLKAYTVKNIRQMLQALIHQGYLAKSNDEYPVVILTDKSQSVMQENTDIKMKMLLDQAPERELPAANRTYAGEMDETLFQKLKQVRMQFARAEHVPAYIIFSDATLKDMARIKPRTPDQFLSVSGVGEVKKQKYGKAFIEAIQTYLQK